MTGKELKVIRHAMGLTQVGLAERLRVTRNSVNRWEFGGQDITPSMELLIQYVARDAGVDIASHSRADGRSAAPEKAGRAESGHSARKGRGRAR